MGELNAVAVMLGVKMIENDVNALIRLLGPRFKANLKIVDEHIAKGTLNANTFSTMFMGGMRDMSKVEPFVG